MPDDNTSGATQADASDNTSAQAATQTTPEPQAGDGQEPMSLDEAKKLRQEANSLRKRLKTFEDAQAAADQAKLSEQEKLQKQLNDLQAQYNEAQRQSQEDRQYSALERAGRTLGIADSIALEDAVKLALIDLALDESDAEPDFEAAMKTILKSRPWLTRGATPSSSGATNPSRSQVGNVGQITRDNLEQAMKDYNTLSPSQKAEVTRLLTTRI
jgi:hypothetical protein